MWPLHLEIVFVGLEELVFNVENERNVVEK